MSWNIRPLLSALLRNPTGAVLVGLQIAITLATLSNAAWIVSGAIAKVEQPAGLDIDDMFVITVMGVSNRFNIGRAASEDLAYLRGLPGVAAATVTEGEPLTPNGSDTLLGVRPDQQSQLVQTSMMPLDEQGLRTLDVPLVAGRNFAADDVRSYSSGAPQPSEVIVTQSLARALFPHGRALGRSIYDSGGDSPMTIIGITRDFMGPQLGDPPYNVEIYPQLLGRDGVYNLLVRTQPGREPAILRQAPRHIAAAHPDGVVAHIPSGDNALRNGEALTLREAKRTLDANDRNTAIFLTAITALMVAVCALGVFGLTTFNVSSRIRHTGVRRALGARRGDIVAHFLIENALVLTAGIVLGSLLALAIGQWLSDHYSEPRLDPLYLLWGMLGLGLTGALAAWQPARKAAAVPPSVATRTV
jgi:putative ABC transport system permease protein